MHKTAIISAPTPWLDMHELQNRIAHDYLPEQAAAEIKIAAAVKLFELGRLSSGAAARLVGMPRTLFLSRLADYEVETFRLTEAELQQEAALV